MLSRDRLILSTGTLGSPAFADTLGAVRDTAFSALAIWMSTVERWRAEDVPDTEARRQLTDAGIGVDQLDAMTLWMLGPDSQRARHEEAAMFEAAEAFGAGAVSILSPGDDRFSPEQLTERLAGLCARAAERGLVIALEAAPWKGPIGLEAAAGIVVESGAANAALVIDSWHMFRGAVTEAELAGLPRGGVWCVQLSDAPSTPAADLTNETMTARLLPGEGAIDLAAFLTAMDSVVDDRPVTVEVLNSELLAQGPAAVARRSASATLRLLNPAPDAP